MLNLIFVALGGATGAILRFSMSGIFKFFFNNTLYATLGVNIIGSLLIGYLISIGYLKNFSENFITYFLIIGLLGSFTTFSSFSIEVVELFLSKKFFFGFFYITLSVFFCIMAAYIGMYINKF